MRKIKLLCICGLVAASLVACGKQEEVEYLEPIDETILVEDELMVGDLVKEQTIEALSELVSEHVSILKTIGHYNETLLDDVVDETKEYTEEFTNEFVKIETGWRINEIGIPY